MKRILTIILFLQIGCTQVQDCSSDPCENGGVCINEEDGYQCDCKETGFVGTNCETTPRPFITIWKTDNEGVSENNQIIISTKGDGYDYSIDCDSDAVAEADHQKGDYTCEYEKPGTYTVSITGDFPRIYFDPGGVDENTYDNKKLVSIKQWGTIEWKSMEKAFFGCANLRLNAEDTPNLSNVTNMMLMFANTNEFNQPLNLWKVSSVTDMTGIFGNSKKFNQPLNLWDVSNVTDMTGMFEKSEAFNQDLNGWNTSKVTTMERMFAESAVFNGKIDKWDVSSVTTMQEMFAGSVAFNSKIESWDVSKVENMHGMFRETEVFNQEIDSWDVSQVEYMSSMFRESVAFNQDLDSWDMSNTPSILSMFFGSKSFNGKISSWNTSHFSSMPFVFQDAIAFNQDLSSWDVLRVENIALSTENYDKTLQAWSTLTPRYGVRFDAGGSKYCASEAARQKLISTYKWEINDGGKDPGCEE